MVDRINLVPGAFYETNNYIYYFVRELQKHYEFKHIHKSSIKYSPDLKSDGGYFNKGSTLFSMFRRIEKIELILNFGPNSLEAFK